MNTAQSSRAHAALSPSAAHRFINCPGSVPYEASLPAEDRSSDAANEGTAAHELASWCLEMEREPSDMLGRVVNIVAEIAADRFLAEGTPHKDNTNLWPVTDEMVQGVKIYVDYVRSLDGELSIEERLDISHIHPDCWGTGDALIYKDKHLHVIDLKYGRGVVVEVENNSQLTLYASGAARRYSNRGVEKVTMTIVQPRADHHRGPVRPLTINMSVLKGAEEYLAEATVRVDEARKSFFKGPHTPALESVMAKWQDDYLSAGDWCRFCRVGAVCPKRAEKVIEDAQAEFAEDGTMVLPEPAKLTSEQLAELLLKARQIQHWVNSVEEHANAEALEGRVPDGFKLVAKRAIRKWKNEGDEGVITMMVDVNPDVLFDEPKRLSPAQLEKKLSKEQKAHLTPFITKSSSGFNLVPEEDPRPNKRPSAEQEFTSIEG